MSGRKPTFLLVWPGFPATQQSPTATYAAFRKESRMEFVNVNNLDRKSGDPDFLPRSNHRRQRMRLSVKKAAWSSSMLAISTGNPAARPLGGIFN
jgi:hypothetical protein